MNAKDIWKPRLVVIACAMMISHVAIAQQPFGTLPGTKGAQGGQDDPIIIRPQEDRTPTRPFQTPPDFEELPDQVVELNSQFAGWHGAGAGRNKARLDKDLRANWVMVDSNGRFEGTVIPGEGAEINEMTVYLLNMGRLVKESSVDAQGGFQFTNVRQGAYTLAGWGSKGFFAFGLNILAYNEDATATTPQSVTTMAFQNASTINTDWIQYFAPQVSFRVYGRYPEGEGQENSASLYGFEGLAKYLPKGTPATSIQAHPVKRTADGRLLGRVHQITSITGRPVDIRNTKVMLLKGDEVVASTDTDNYGVFELTEIPDGEYGLVAAGIDGMGLIGIVVGDEDETEDLEIGDEFSDAEDTGEYIDFCIVSSETIGWLNHYATELAYRRNLLAPRRPDSDNRTCQNCGGTGCNTCGGTGLCTSRYQSFQDWAARCRNQHERTKLGSGYILSEFTKDVRRVVDRTGDTFEKAFYGDSGFDGDGVGVGYGGGYNQGYNGNGYNDGYGSGYNGYGQGYNGYGQGYNGYGQDYNGYGYGQGYNGYGNGY